jgi:uncharacterized cupin superfamily protein
MVIDFEKIGEKTLEHFKGGEKYFLSAMYVDEDNKIMRGRLVPGSSIGYHKHETNSEIVYILEGECKVLYDGIEGRLHKGDCHYCNKGHSHSLINDSVNDVIFIAVVPEHK